MENAIMHMTIKAGGVALLALGLSGCGWFGADFPVRNGPQSEPHVTYATSGQVAERMVTQSSAAGAGAQAVCGAQSAAAAERAAAATGRFGAPLRTNPDGDGARGALFNDHSGTAVMITSGPGGYECMWSGPQGVSTWRNGAPA
ncbi:hypothetical protein D6850_00135 [Roseovarius spongiae]|uniref:Uncharacterized protein n=1 Tax=Roseovarius spongiae TaxID=2320272 RepID=A0A3A8BAD1_9RHOB|nr:hypothetical protein [Roseovarius spongiae]RKF16022.1 hypothetical protein D6850_00135 [Roseovarius spongiae]